MKYEVLSKLKFNGSTYEKGDVVTVDEKNAAPLIEAGVIIDPDKKDPALEVDNSNPNKSKKGLDVKMNQERLPGEPGHEHDPALDGKGKLEKEPKKDEKKEPKK